LQAKAALKRPHSRRFAQKRANGGWRAAGCRGDIEKLGFEKMAMNLTKLNQIKPYEFTRCDLRFTAAR
jgi:hypothetical protein